MMRLNLVNFTFTAQLICLSKVNYALLTVLLACTIGAKHAFPVLFLSVYKPGSNNCHAVDWFGDPKIGLYCLYAVYPSCHLATNALFHVKHSCQV